MTISKYGTFKDIYRFTIHLDKLSIVIMSMYKPEYIPPIDKVRLTIWDNMDEERKSSVEELFNSNLNKPLGLKTLSPIYKAAIISIFSKPIMQPIESKDKLTLCCEIDPNLVKRLIE